MKTVCVCASKNFSKEVAQFCSELRTLGVVVFEPSINEPVPENSFIQSEFITKIIFKGFTLEHFDWIRKADVCYIYNKNDYVGISVTLEMGYANALGKPIYAFSAKTGDPCRDSLIDKTVTEPNELLNLLK